MRVYNKIVFDMSSMKVVYTESFEYSGEVSLCGGRGGGGGSGKVDYPEYMKNIHEAWLNEISSAIYDARAHGSPFAGDSAYNPDNNISDLTGEIYNFRNIAHALNWEHEWSIAAMHGKDTADMWMSSSYIDSLVDSFNSYMEDDLSDNVIPKFESGMRDQGAVYSSAFVIGRGLIYSRKSKDVSAYRAKLVASFENSKIDYIFKTTQQLLENLYHLMDISRDAMHYTIEGNRISIIAKKEQQDQDLNIEDKDARWDLDVFQYGANMLAAIGGGTASPGSMEPSKFQSALSGGLSGAATGAMLAPVLGMTGPVGAGIGATIGLLGGIF